MKTAAFPKFIFLAFPMYLMGVFYIFYVRLIAMSLLKIFIVYTCALAYSSQQMKGSSKLENLILDPDY